MIFYENVITFLHRYMIPKGSRDGTAFQFVVVVYPCERIEIPHMNPHNIVRPGSTELFLDHKPLLYPFDRMIKFEKMWYHIPNIYFHDEMVYFTEDVNSSHHLEE